MDTRSRIPLSIDKAKLSKLSRQERETDIQWSNEQISPYGFFENMYVPCRIIEANEVEKNAHHYLSQ